MSAPTQEYFDDLLSQISTNLQNTSNTFGPSSQQYKDVLQTLRNCIKQIEENLKPEKPVPLDPTMLTQAMELLNLSDKNS
ncbi:uncharacterized protein TRUGW13939_05239 [Talaromyces rugulosus]|uniref:Mediator of RNA polymerase II transcription subunit 10 n=1 Tax=Talaromyces rugulosus TaxID=121627 RepID=A0A7H8QWX2_TALRU|nr:uncharacterized protein TRUGW13939_05239 [Talaromyces rugulosus]QKX58118.1 hypothetical protein TRUGW13939_05239 [Talaromyces rugulosus]